MEEYRALRRPGMELFLYSTCLGQPPGWIEFENGDFLAAVGTCLYRGGVGPESLRELYRDFTAGRDCDAHLAGNYAVLIGQGERLSLLGDRSGYYGVYTLKDGSAFSSSFLATTYLADSLSLSPQELYEYVFYGFFFHQTTLFEEVRLLDHERTWRLLPETESSPRATIPQGFPPGAGFGDMLAQVEAKLLDYFRTLGDAYGGSFTAALSGGYDSRLMLAILRKLGYSPHLYVYGSPAHEDVRVAKAIANGEKLALEHVDKSAHPRPALADWPALLERDFHFFDGLKATGVFDNGSDHLTRVDRARKGELQLNGAGGEIYREIWNLPNRSLSIRRFLQVRYDTGDYGFCTGAFDAGSFFDALARKVHALLNTSRRRISRREVEMLFPRLRNIFAASNTTINNQIGPSLLPYMEPRFVDESYEIPIKYKDYGRFNAALIRSLDPSLASYQSAYGINFTDPISPKTRLTAKIRQNVPVGLRLLRRTRRYAGSAQPFYLGGDYYRTIFGDRPLAVAEYLDPAGIRDPVKRARALTVELFLGDYFR